MNPELDIRKEQVAKGEKIQVISPQTSFVMIKLLEQTVNNGGTLGAQKWHFDYRDANGKRYTMPAGGKTGTTQNWADAWTCGITPYYAAAFWFGFDKPGQSLGLNITGATLAGFAWGEYFDKIHADLPLKNWIKPLEGVIECTVCADSGMILTESCEHSTTQWYLEGTQPTEICPIHSSSSNSVISIIRLEKEMYKSGQRMSFDFDTTPLSFDLSAPLESEFETDEEEEDSEEENTTSTSKFDYSYLME